MIDQTYLTPEEVAERYRGTVSIGTLRNWRSMRIGPAYVKVGKSVLYPVNQLEIWDQTNIVKCRASKRLGMRGGDQR
ncbi:helix-turn-helix domain-containing protein [Xanthobacter sp. VTT E-85241]|uniref:helix-turn-helix domain-containing protein n=1 Tax=Roseixanthobacter finlandensis TaxID=3119922 RepID=UPI0037281810